MRLLSPQRRLICGVAVIGLVVLGAGFRNRAPVRISPAKIFASDALTIALAPQPGAEPIDREIAAAQQRAAVRPEAQTLEPLGWLLVKKARLSNDPGYYKIAEQCALAIEAKAPDQAGALLLRGHAIEAMHRFHDAESLARKLVAQREFFLDFALLGDALMEQGRLEEAVEACQKMADLKPCLQTYVRIAHLRWLKGDLEGAIEMAEEAAHTGSARDPETLAWVLTKLAAYRLQKGDLAGSQLATQQALGYVPASAGALLLRGRLALAQHRWAEALPDLREAARLNPLPEVQWALAEALREAGQTAEAAAVCALISSRGAAEDPRSFSIYLATRGEQPALAVKLARAELQNRQDVFTYDALAWSEYAAGNLPEAQQAAEKATAEGTQDARLLLHAGIIAQASGAATARAQLHSAQVAQQTLLPSERGLLEHALATLLSQK